MDLNELLRAHQLEVMKASAAGDEESRQRHFVSVAGYAEAIQELRALPRTGTLAGFPDSRETLTYGTYAGEPAPEPGPAVLNTWEDEGGSLDPPNLTLPSGITVSLLPEYHVGPYVYRDLACAMAEFERQRSTASLASVGDD